MNKASHNIDSLNLCKTLIQHTNIESLSECFLKIVKGETGADRASLFILTHETDLPELDESSIREINMENRQPAYIQNKLSADELESLNLCLGSGSEVEISIKPNVSRYIIPLRSPSHLQGFLLLESRPFNSYEKKILDAIIAIFNTQYNLLNQSRIDDLTGLLNRGAFDTMIYQLILKQRKHQRSSDDENMHPTLALLDIDHFKRINDNFGHIYGDEVLILFAQLMQKTFRHFDFLFRYGGEEFAVILHHVHHKDVPHVLERFRKNVEKFHFPQIGKVTISIGAVEIKPGDAVPLILDKADKALYYAKNNGRNQSHLYDNLIEAGAIEEEKVRSGDIDLF